MDIIAGGPDNDTLYGGNGADTINSSILGDIVSMNTLEEMSFSVTVGGSCTIGVCNLSCHLGL